MRPTEIIVTTTYTVARRVAQEMKTASILAAVITEVPSDKLIQVELGDKVVVYLTAFRGLMVEYRPTYALQRKPSQEIEKYLDIAHNLFEASFTHAMQSLVRTREGWTAF